MNKRKRLKFWEKASHRVLKTTALSLAMLMATVLHAQNVPTPAPKQPKPIILQSATIHIGNGKVIEKGDVLIVEGKIVDVGAIRTRVPDAETYDLSGMHLYPGLIAPVTQIGLDEIEAVRATEDIREVGAVNPNARTIIGYNADSRVTPTVRSNGILLTQVSPRGSMFMGTSSIVQLDAWNWQDAAYQLDDAVHLNWPNLRVWGTGPVLEERKKRITKSLADIDAAMNDARAYLAAKEGNANPPQDLHWEALIPVLKKEKPLFVHGNSEKQIQSIVAFMLRHDVRIVLVGGADAWLTTNLLKQYDIPVVLRQPHSLPRLGDDAVDMPYRLPGLLHKAGLTVCLSMRDFWNQRNLPFQAGTAAAHGLPKETALQLITLNTAKILGIADRTGSIESGKDANLVVSKGDLLDMRTSQVVHAFIQGRKLDLGNKQKDLYEKFRKRLGME